MSEPAEESGAQLLARLVSICRPQINGLDKILFPNGGPFPKEITEISGDVGLGKTTLLMHIMAKVILPLEYGGRDGMVLLLLTEHNFDSDKFIGILQNSIDGCKSMNASEADIVQLSLQNITIQRCFDEMQFELAIYNLDKILSESNRYCLLALDNVGAFYNASEAQRQGHSLYTKDIVKRLRRVIIDYHLALVYTKPAYFYQKSTMNRLENVNYFLELIDDTDESTEDSCFICKVSIARTNETILWKYEFDVNGFIEWKK